VNDIKQYQYQIMN